jgi:hypothetical protein
MSRKSSETWGTRLSLCAVDAALKRRSSTAPHAFRTVARGVIGFSGTTEVVPTGENFLQFRG